MSGKIPNAPPAIYNRRATKEYPPPPVALLPNAGHGLLILEIS